MTIEQALSQAHLPRTEAEVLLSALLQKDRSWLLAHPTFTLQADLLSHWQAWAKRRQRGEPTAYITQRQEFYGRSFLVDNRVLIPRPSTEGLVELALASLDQPTDRVVELDTQIAGVCRVLQSRAPVVIVDIGTGSGCIAITMALEQPDRTIIASDRSADALRVAQENAERHSVRSRITFLEGDALQPLMDLTEPFLLVSNPPYIPAGTPLAANVRDYEPEVALFAGPDGTDVLRKIVTQAVAHPHCVALVVECRTEQVRIVSGAQSST